MNAIPMLTRCMQLQDPKIMLPMNEVVPPETGTLGFTPSEDTRMPGARRLELEADESDAFAQTGLTSPDLGYVTAA